MTQSKHTSVPFYRNAKVLPYLWQGAILLAVIAGVLVLLFNLKRGMESQNLDTSFDFLGRSAGFRISEGLPFSPEDTYFKAFLVGLYNTVRATVVGIVFATLIGLVVAVARLSKNWLVNRLAYFYIELMRNTPLLVQLVFWYFAVILQLPGVRDAIKFGPAVFLSQRGLVIPWIDAPAQFWWMIVVGVAISIGLWTLLNRVGPGVAGKKLGMPLALVVLIGVGFATYFMSGSSLSISRPELGTFRIQGGLTLSPEFTALLAALVFYFGAFIAEVVRGGVNAVPKGQWEAARALGLGYLTTLRIIILPQAMRIIVPPLGNIYLNLTKASSLAIAIGYPDLFGLSATIGSQSGFSVQVMLMVLITYLALTLTVAAGVNVLNRSVQMAGR